MTTTYKQGDILRYEDRANPAQLYVITQVRNDPWWTYRLEPVDQDGPNVAPINSDCRQAGWSKVGEA